AILGPEGKQLDDSWGLFDGYPATLPATGTYKVVVLPWANPTATFTLWDVRDAPAAALSPDRNDCPGCSSSSASSSGILGSSGTTPTTVATRPDATTAP